eukprot:PhF_6_TR27874/c0_g1_i8/m.40784
MSMYVLFLAFGFLSLIECQIYTVTTGFTGYSGRSLVVNDCDGLVYFTTTATTSKLYSYNITTDVVSPVLYTATNIEIWGICTYKCNIILADKPSGVFYLYNTKTTQVTTLYSSGRNGGVGCFEDPFTTGSIILMYETVIIRLVMSPKKETTLLMTSSSLYRGVTVDVTTGLIYVADTVKDGIIELKADGSSWKYVVGGTSTTTESNGIGTAAQINGPYGLATNSVGDMYVSTTQGHTIWKIAKSNFEATMIAGTSGTSGQKDGI